MRRLEGTAVSLLAIALVLGAGSAAADPRLLPRLNDEQRPIFLQWQEARTAFERATSAYWATVETRRSERRRKHAAREPFTPADYVMQHPPKYHGPQLRPDIARMLAELAPAPAPSPESEIASLAQMLAAARQHYRFAPALIPEQDFKRRYAAEALAIGLTREEVVRIYAFETGGRGTFDMQAGINPDTRQGRPISTAMGYAQLLAANTIGELVKYGEGFISRLGMIAVRRDTPPDRAREITAKIEAMRAMMRVGRSVPREWSQHTAMARTPQGYGMHVLNLDGDVGPWLQVMKLKGIKETAEQAGRPHITPAELELMNLAGPRTGLEMMEPLGRTAPTANFFTQGAYARNSVVRERTAAELLAIIDERMNDFMKRQGSLDFLAAFEEAMSRVPSVAGEGRQNLLPTATVRAVQPRSAAPLPVPAAVAPVPAAVVFTPPQPAQAAPPPPALVAPPPVRVERPVIPPTPRMQWAPPGFADRSSLPLGFGD